MWKLNSKRQMSKRKKKMKDKHERVKMKWVDFMKEMLQ